MTGILSLTTFSPLIGVAAILLLRMLGRRDDAATAGAAKWIAFATTLTTLALTALLVVQFDPNSAGFQFREQIPLFAGFSYDMGVDGISILFVLLTAFLMPLCIAASWGIRERVTEYMIAFLVLEVLVIGVFTALDMLLFYLFFEGGLIPMFLIIGVWGGKNRIYAAYKFFLYTLLGSILMLGAMLFMIATLGTSSIPELIAGRR
jgi:NADH-quinone oxidoreductase subunit M